MSRFYISVPLLLSVTAAAHAMPQIVKEEPRVLESGKSVIFADRTCGTGFRRVTANEDGTRERKCVGLNRFPPEIVLSEGK